MTRKDAQDYPGDSKPINITIVNKETQTWELVRNSFSINEENKGQASNIFKTTLIYPVNSDLKVCCRSGKKHKAWNRPKWTLNQGGRKQQHHTPTSKDCGVLTTHHNNTSPQSKKMISRSRKKQWKSNHDIRERHRYQEVHAE